MTRQLRDESGQVLVITVLCMTVLLGFVAFATDVGTLLYQKRLMQTAADSGAVAGAAEIYYSDWRAAAQADSAQNGFTDGVNGATVTVNNGPASGPNAGNKGYVEVIVSQPQPTFFMKLFNFNSMTVSARSVATVTPSKTCIVTLNNNNTGVPAPGWPPGATGAGIAGSGSASLSVPGCGIDDNAGISGDSAVNLSGSANIHARSLSTAGTVASGDLSAITVTNPSTVTTGITPTADPLATVYPATPANPGSCTALTVSSSATIGPALGGSICYSSLTVSGGSTIATLNPGFYYINGNLTVQGGAALSCTGTCATSGVTFYITNNGQVTVSGGSALNLTATTSGTYSGALFYQDKNDAKPATITGGSSGTVNGILYFPSAGVTISSSSTTFNVDLVVSWINLTGPATISPYALLNIPSPLSSPILAE